jgi:hypothetical protein
MSAAATRSAPGVSVGSSVVSVAEVPREGVPGDDHLRRRHLSNILTKIDVSSRTAASAYEHGLV